MAICGVWNRHVVSGRINRSRRGNYWCACLGSYNMGSEPASGRADDQGHPESIKGIIAESKQIKQ